MEIFGKHIFGTDSENWLKQCKKWKKEWILKNTIQRNETLIDDFINNPNITKDCKCLNCGKNGDKSDGIPKEIATDVKSGSDTIDNSKDNIERSVKSKSRKSK